MTTQAIDTAQPVKAAASSSWTIDPKHSHVGFGVRHLMITTVRGEFSDVTGTVKWNKARPEDIEISVDIPVASVNTREAQRDSHLRSADFFDAEHFPTITFKSRGVGRVKDGQIELVGDLTIRGTTRSVILDVEGPTPEQSDPWGNVRIGASAKTKIKRSEFGMTWNTILETGGLAVSDEISIAIEVSLVKEKA